VKMPLRELLRLIDPDEEGFWNLPFPPAAQLAVAACGLMLFTEAERLRRALWILSRTDLIIHEARPPIFSPLFFRSRVIMFVGGTALQLLMPAAFMVECLRRRQPFGSDFALFWLGQNFLHIAPYVADARAQQLPLVGGGEHDWNYLLGVFGLLERDGDLARL